MNKTWVLSCLIKRHDSLRPTTTAFSTKSFWCENVVFSNDECQATTMTRGSVDVDEYSGVIVACHPGEDWKGTKLRNPSNSDRLASGILSPGLIDVHTHISALGRNWEGYTTATKAAAAGGITTLMGMPLNSIPSTTTLDAVEMEKKEATEKSDLHVDVGLWGGVVPDNIGCIKYLLESPYIFGLKAFLAPLPPAAGYQAVSPEQLQRAAEVCAPTGKPILVHSELMTEEESQKAAKDSFSLRDSSSYEAHVQSRPAKWEQDAVQVVCQCTKPDPEDSSVSCRMHIVHLSDARGCLPIIQEYKAQLGEGILLSVETCPHYLLLDESMIQDGETLVKCFPPIRDAENREMLWEGLRNGLIDMVASDHSPCEPSLRNIESRDIKTAWGGFAGLQYQLQATWTDAVRRNFGALDISRWWSENPARLAGLDHNKGRIAVGYNADFCWWDSEHEGPPNEYSQEYHRWPGTTIFAENPLMRGRVLGSFVKGHKVNDGEKDLHLEPFGELLTYKQ